MAIRSIRRLTPGLSDWPNRGRKTRKSANRITHSSAVISSKFVPEQTTLVPGTSNQQEAFQTISPEVKCVNLRQNQENLADVTPASLIAKPKLSDSLLKTTTRMTRTSPTPRKREPPSSTLYSHHPKLRKVILPVISLLIPSN